MNRGKELLKNTAIIAIGNISTKLISFFLLPLYTSLLSAADYGIYDLLISYATFIVPVITFLIEESMFRFLIDCKTYTEKKTIISQTVIFITISSLLGIILYMVISSFINIPYCYIFLLYLMSTIILLLKNALTRGLGKVKLYTFSNFVTSLSIIILNVVFIVYLKLGVVSLLISYILSNMIVSLFVLVKLDIKKYVSFKSLNKKKICEMLKYSLPLIPNSLSWTIINLSDRIIISNTLGVASNGIYSISCKFPNLMDTIYGFFYTSWREIAAKSLKDKDSQLFYNKVYSVLNDFMWAIVIMIIAFLPFVFNIIIKKEFIQSYTYIPILIVAMYFSNISGFFGGIFSAHKDTKIMGISSITAAIFNLVINILLINYLGLWAASISTLISTVIVYIYRKIKLKKYIKLEENLLKIILSYIALLVGIFSYYSNNIMIQTFVLLVLTIYSAFINKEILLVIKNKLLLIK